VRARTRRPGPAGTAGPDMTAYQRQERRFSDDCPAAFAIARPVPGVGIVTPALAPAAVATILPGGPAIAALAYVAGTFGTLIGADLLSLPRVRSLQAPVVSIGGDLRRGLPHRAGRRPAGLVATEPHHWAAARPSKTGP